MRTEALAIAILMTSATAAVAAEEYTEPDWLKRPTPDMLSAVWPKGAGNGRAIISCKVSTQGTLFDCKVDSEAPEGRGFGAAAIAMTPQLLMRPARHNGQPVVGNVRIPLNFKLPAGSGPPDSFGARPVVRPSMAWKRSPTYAEVAAAYPEKARSAGVGGLATLQCGFTSTGVLGYCETLREEPKGYGFGAAAKNLSKLFQAYPSPPGQRLQGAVVQLPVAFDPAMLKGGVPVVGKPNWSGVPSAEDIAGAYPKAPPGVETLRTRLACRVEQEGYVSGCRVESEDPPGNGFGPAALALAPRFRLGTWTMEGLPVVGGTVNIPLRYDAKDAPAPK
jgi:TonB family protein